MAEWVDGSATAGSQSALAKRNVQRPEGSEAARRGGQVVLDALAAVPLFVAAALPLKVYPPLFNRYGVGEAFGAHVDGLGDGVTAAAAAAPVRRLHRG